MRRAVIYFDISFVCPDTHTRLIRVYLFCLTFPGNKRRGAPPLLRFYGFIWNIPGHAFLLRGREWLRQSVSVENLHGNKSHNLSQVCTLDWLRAITLTKKAFFFPPLFLLPAFYHPLSASCQINPLNFPKDLRLFPFFCL